MYVSASHFMLVSSPVVQDEDFSASDALNVTFSAGSTSNGATVCADVVIIDDDALEGDHSFTVMLDRLILIPGGEYMGLTIGSPNSASVMITDNDGMCLA